MGVQFIMEGLEACGPELKVTFEYSQEENSWCFSPNHHCTCADASRHPFLEIQVPLREDSLLWRPARGVHYLRRDEEHFKIVVREPTPLQPRAIASCEYMLRFQRHYFCLYSC
jgi:hypothetical protein